MGKVVFLDTETTGLYPHQGHEIWELAIITEDGKEYEWQLPVDLEYADPMALKIGKFHERRAKMDKEGVGIAMLSQEQLNGDGWTPIAPREMAEGIAILLNNVHLVGAVPSFDDAFLKKFLQENNQAPTWHYHLIDIEALVVGYLYGLVDGVHGSPAPIPLPWKSDQLSEMMGVDPKRFEHHTALGDASWAKVLYYAVMGGKSA